MMYLSHHFLMNKYLIVLEFWIPPTEFSLILFTCHLNKGRVKGERTLPPCVIATQQGNHPCPVLLRVRADRYQCAGAHRALGAVRTQAHSHRLTRHTVHHSGSANGTEVDGKAPDKLQYREIHFLLLMHPRRAVGSYNAVLRN